MYILDTNVFRALGHYYQSRFPTIWAHLDDLANNQELGSVKEVLRELESNCPFGVVEDWVKTHRSIFRPPSVQEMRIVAEIFEKEQYRGFVKKQNILKGRPVADPFIVAAAKVQKACVVTLELEKAGGARIPTACKELNIKCINLEELFEKENLGY